MANEILKTNLDPACICLNLESDTSDDAIRELIELLRAKYKFRSTDEVLGVMLAREQKMSTTLENGVAVPRAKTDLVDRTMIAVGIRRSGIDFKSADGRPAKIIVSVLSPLSKTGAHVRCLAEITRLLHSEVNRNKIIEAKDAGTIYRIMSESGV